MVGKIRKPATREAPKIAMSRSTEPTLSFRDPFSADDIVHIAILASAIRDPM
jgi:hypothetical protein